MCKRKPIECRHRVETLRCCRDKHPLRGPRPDEDRYGPFLKNESNMIYDATEKPEHFHFNSESSLDGEAYSNSQE